MARKLCASRALFALVSLLTIGPAAEAALANRVFAAAKTGSDSNACNSVSTPCQTLAGALTQVVAGGEIIVLESGGYGPVSISMAVTIDAPAGILAFIHPPSGDAITINAGAGATVILRGLTLNGGAGNGITVNAVGRLLVEHCTITGYGNDGIHFAAPGGTLLMRGDDVRGCSHSGVLVASGGTTAQAVIRDSSFSGNDTGVWASDNTEVAVTDSVASANTTYGFLSTTVSGSSAGTFMTLDRVQAVANGTGLQSTGTFPAPAKIQFANCHVAHNYIGVNISGTYGVLQGSVPATSLIVNNGNDNLGALQTGVSLR